MITKRKLNKKLDLLIRRQNIIGTILIRTQLDNRWQKKFEKMWEQSWDENME